MRLPGGHRGGRQPAAVRRVPRRRAALPNLGARGRGGAVAAGTACPRTLSLPGVKCASTRAVNTPCALETSHRKAPAPCRSPRPPEVAADPKAVSSECAPPRQDGGSGGPLLLLSRPSAASLGRGCQTFAAGTGAACCQVGTVPNSGESAVAACPPSFPTIPPLRKATVSLACSPRLERTPRGARPVHRTSLSPSTLPARCTMTCGLVARPHASSA